MSAPRSSTRSPRVSALFRRAPLTRTNAIFCQDSFAIGAPNERAFSAGYVSQGQSIFRVLAPGAQNWREKRRVRLLPMACSSSTTRRAARRSGVEITAPSAVTSERLNRLLADLHESPLNAHDYLPIRADVVTLSVGDSHRRPAAIITHWIVSLCSAPSRPRRSAPPPRSAALRALTAPPRSDGGRLRDGRALFAQEHGRRSYLLWAASRGILSCQW